MDLLLRICTKFNKQKFLIRIPSYTRSLHKDGKVKTGAQSVSWSVYVMNSPFYAVNATMNMPESRIAFNCGEGFSRLVDEDENFRKISISHLFITRMDWSNLTGLPGIVKSQQRIGTRNLSLYGPSKLNVLAKQIMRSLGRIPTKLNTFDCDKEQKFVENLFTVRAIPLLNSLDKNEKVIAYVGEARGNDITLDDRRTEAAFITLKTNFLGKDIHFSATKIQIVFI